MTKKIMLVAMLLLAALLLVAGCDNGNGGSGIDSEEEVQVNLPASVGTDELVGKWTFNANYGEETSSETCVFKDGNFTWTYESLEGFFPFL